MKIDMVIVFLFFVGLIIAFIMIYHINRKKLKPIGIKKKEIRRLESRNRIQIYKEVLPRKIFKVNNHLTLKLIFNNTITFIDEEPFIQCMGLLFNIPAENYGDFNTINSIDEAVRIWDDNIRNDSVFIPEITPEEEFLGHCSNLQAWYENDYDTRILHSNIAFPLLKRLAKVGDQKAMRVFKEEVAKRLLEGYYPVFTLLMTPEYLVFFTIEELQFLMEECETLYKKVNFFNSQMLVADVFEEMGHNYYYLPDLNKAIFMYRYALKFDPKTQRLWYFLGDAYIKNGQFNEGLKIYKDKYLIMIDEAHEILEKPKYQSYDDDETVTRHYLEIVFEKLLRAFRSRGIGLIIADQLPRNLFEGIYKLPSIRVIFRSDKDFLQFISNNAEEQDALAYQKDRRALILDGVNSRKFAIRTIDYSIQEVPTEIPEKLCQKCNELLETNLKFCKKCGTIA